MFKKTGYIHTYTHTYTQQETGVTIKGNIWKADLPNKSIALGGIETLVRCPEHLKSNLMKVAVMLFDTQL